MFEDFKWYKHLGQHQTAWAGHILYIYNQIPEWKPKTIVELGVYLGHSLATMAESCLDNDLDTKLYGIDHFMGDEHSGKFGTEVEDIATKCLSEYPNVTLIKKSFNEALKDWDGAIDLLHIDGRHFYDDIKEDFFNWAKFVPIGGHIIMHDSQETERGFGIKKFFEELQKQYPNWEYQERKESHGLAICTKRSEL
jgi:predicted O-methyltransferase YrrM